MPILPARQQGGKEFARIHIGIEDENDGGGGKHIECEAIAGLAGHGQFETNFIYGRLSLQDRAERDYGPAKASAIRVNKL